MIRFTRMDLTQLTRMSVPDFDSLHESCERIKAQERVERAWTAMIAAQAAGKDMEKWLKQWEPLLEADKKHTGGMEEFRRKFGTDF